MRRYARLDGGSSALFDERSVLLFDDPASLAEKLRNPSLLASVSTTALQLVGNQFSLGAMIDSYGRLYAKVVRK